MAKPLKKIQNRLTKSTIMVGQSPTKNKNGELAVQVFGRTSIKTTHFVISSFFATCVSLFLFFFVSLFLCLTKSRLINGVSIFFPASTLFLRKPLFYSQRWFTVANVLRPPLVYGQHCLLYPKFDLTTVLLQLLGGHVKLNQYTSINESGPKLYEAGNAKLVSPDRQRQVVCFPGLV